MRSCEYEPRPPLPLTAATHLCLGALAVLGLAAIALLPTVSAHMAIALPEYADLRAPLLALAIGAIVLALVVLAVIGLLVQRIHRGAILVRSSLTWVDAMIASFLGGAAIVVASGAVIDRGQAGSPFLLLAEAAAFVVMIALACLTGVLRSLLRRSILMRDKLDEVI
ncbi:DUF2975 domain-containing protein [Actinomyces sp. B33]|uniref:DUF2975 domain-containing protein n=1 Tax=Actinomyces sp. B33 TaxID=2942131 RepID=UPI002340BB05|nr:DUF2975 domain-containing protein [Actinomyces sp. B33]MDC4232561.1 DUF2975 domain-containing protein [Actinomyces sp. B33]